LLPSAARQQLLYHAFGEAPPRWIHVPLVVDGSGRRLAKRTDAVSLATLRESGVPPHEVIAWAAQSIGIDTDGICDLHDIAAVFSVSTLLKESVGVFERWLSLTNKM
jgi:glutamyl-tRNA synthetase